MKFEDIAKGNEIEKTGSYFGTVKIGIAAGLQAARQAACGCGLLFMILLLGLISWGAVQDAEALPRQEVSAAAPLVLQQGDFTFWLKPAKPRPGQAVALFGRTKAGKPLPFTRIAAGKKIFKLERLAAGSRGVVAVPLGTRPGAWQLRFLAPGADVAGITLELTVVPCDYGEQRLSLPSGMVTPIKPRVLTKIRHDRKELRRVYGSSGTRLLLEGPVRPPLDHEITSTFGRRRLLNGKPKAPHGGIDYRAKVGVPVPAAAAGRVALAEKLYYSGNLVLIDHGLDIFTLYMHLSRFNCHPGERVARGQIIGYSGCSGRATGPHLHWGVKINGVFVDPLAFARLSRFLLQPPWSSTEKSRTALKNRKTF